MLLLLKQRRSGDSYLHSSLRVKLFDVVLNRLRRFCRGPVSSPVVGSVRSWIERLVRNQRTDRLFLLRRDQRDLVEWRLYLLAVLSSKVTGKSYSQLMQLASYKMSFSYSNYVFKDIKIVIVVVIISDYIYLNNDWEIINLCFQSFSNVNITYLKLHV